MQHLRGGLAPPCIGHNINEDDDDVDILPTYYNIWNLVGEQENSQCLSSDRV